MTLPGSHDPTALELCSREPIHIPGSIQPHGALLVLEEGSLDCLQVSANWTELTGIPIAASSITGKPPEELLGAAAADQVRRSCGGQEAEQLLSLSLPARDFDTVLHRRDGVVIAELEPSAGPLAISLNLKLQQALADLRAAATLPDLYDSMSRSVGLLTGYGRVMVYRFDRDWHGEVVGEYISSPGMESYRGHHFPASDIPEQARALYTKSWLRIIPEVHYTPVPLLPPGNPVTGRPLDLSFSVLRSVSPIHLKYLKNMGVGASMSVSVITEGRLWGLIACHHPSARHLPFHVRSSCEILGQVASLELSFREEKQRLGESAAATRIQTGFFDVIAGEPDFAEALVKYMPRLLEFMNAGGAVLHLNGRTTLLGAAPDEKHLPDLLDWLRTQEMTPVFSTDALSRVFPPAVGYQDCGSGLLAVRLSPVEFECVLFFRPEVITEITWAGNPDKPVIPGRMLSPRHSFDAWVETVRGQSLPWTEAERSGGAELRMALNALVLKLTERLIAANEELAIATARAEAHARAKAEFLANMSHEIRTPLNAVIGMSELLMHGRLEARERGFAETIHSSGDMLLGLINDILDFSKIESGQLELEHIPVPVRDMAESVIDVLAGAAAAKKLELIGWTDPAVPQAVLGDPTRLQQVLMNLVGNAIKFTARGEVFLKLSVREHGGASWLHAAVRDTGIGISAEGRERLFAVFSQVDASTTRRFGGTGLGLVISQRIIRLMGGDIQVESEVGKGSTFQFEIPLQPVEPPVPPEAVEDDARAARHLKDMRVLIVDDNAASRWVLQAQCAAWSMQPTVAEGGAQALALTAAGEKYHLAIIDAAMPDMDGYELAARIRRERNARELPILMLTSMDDPGRDWTSLGISAVLAKPVRGAALLGAVRDILPPAPGAVAGRPAAPPPVETLGVPGSLRILVAEDNPVNQRVVALHLQRMGCPHTMVANGAEALDAVAGTPFDVILMDVQMPVMDGLEAARELCRLYPADRRPWIIALTANAQGSDRDECLEAGMNDYLSKPVRGESLRQALCRAFEETLK